MAPRSFIRHNGARRCVGAALLLALIGCTASSGPSPSPSPTASPGGTTSTLTDVSVYAEWNDDRISEASGLAFTDDTLLTVNDAGDPAIVYCSAGKGGEITGTLTYAAADPVDVEAISADATGIVWVGDIGDNTETRGSIALFRIAASSGCAGDQRTRAERLDLRYPDGPHNAEALLVDPSTGEVLIVTKSGEATKVYSAGVPSGGGAITLTEVEVDGLLGLVSDGTFSPSGDQVWLRNADSVAVYSWPAWTPVTSAELPDQPKGEGLAPGPDGTWLISSEGVGTPVWQWRLTT